ncbi:MAG: hypothetical protein ACOYXT_02395 [Bacteroidota bacterium]
METNANSFALWDQSMSISAFVCLSIAILILIYHEFKIFQIKDYKEKYDYVNLHEIKYFWYAVVALILSAGLYANSVFTSWIISNGMHWFYVRIFLTAGFTVIAYIIFFSLVRIYYPRYVEKRLNKLRNAPRISPAGNPMRKLREDEEEAHLEEGQVAEQNSEIHSIDYDVWIDEKTGYKKIEKYNAYQHAEECSECGYVTMKLDREEILKSPTQQENGLLIKHFKCSYCNHREAREAIVAKLSHNVA